MKIASSTIVYKPLETDRFWNLMERVGEPAGVEVFPAFHLTYYEQNLIHHLPRLAGHDITFHAPYWNTDPCYPQGTPDYDVHMSYFEKTFKYTRMLNASYMVIHPYNLHFMAVERDSKEARFRENLVPLKKMADSYGCRLAVENVEISRDLSDCMFSQEGFIEFAKEDPDRAILIDIGHANCAGWDLEYVIGELKDHIVGYHIHNNNGYVDSHSRLLNGTIDIDAFLRAAGKYTPDADLTIEYAPAFGDDVDGIVEDYRYMKQRI